MTEKKQRPQDKWDAKAGMISKTYKVKRDTAMEFQATCRRLNVSMGIQLTKLMQDFIDKNK